MRPLKPNTITTDIQPTQSSLHAHHRAWACTATYAYGCCCCCCCCCFSTRETLEIAQIQKSIYLDKMYTCIFGKSLLLPDPVSRLLLSVRLSVCLSVCLSSLHSIERAYEQVECKENKIKGDRIDRQGKRNRDFFILARL